MSNAIDTNEIEALFDKKYECPICDKEFVAKTVKTGKCKLESTDDDLRPVYSNIDSLKYDVAFCQYCGFASLKKFMDEPLLPVQKMKSKDKIMANFKGTASEPEAYTYEESIKRHKFALFNLMVREAKLSEQAYTALKIAWLYRGEREHLDATQAEYDEKESVLAEAENEFIHKAYAGFTKAYTTEEFPMCGMDEATYSYLLADLCFKTDHIDEAKRWVSNVITSPGVSNRVKEKARDLKERILAAEDTSEE